jgi:acetyl esterase/lipase
MSNKIWFMLIFVFALSGNSWAKEPQVVNVWPGKPPGETKELPPEVDVNKPTDKPVGDRKIIKLTNVSIPTLAIYATEGEGAKPAVIVCPGGGHYILAYDHEGTEVAEWLNTQGVTAIVLKYRVPARNPEKRWEAAVQDAQRAVSLVRTKASEWSIDPARIGILGFSAGGETAGLTAILHDQRQYATSDKIDEVSCRPDFAVLIYAGGLIEKESQQLRDYVKVSEKTPPMFFAHSADDPVPVHNSIALFSELKKAKVPAEMHIYASGGHGYGIRKIGHPCNAWPERCAEWMRDQSFVK